MKKLLSVLDRHDWLVNEVNNTASKVVNSSVCKVFKEGSRYVFESSDRSVIYSKTYKDRSDLVEDLIKWGLL